MVLEQLELRMGNSAQRRWALSLFSSGRRWQVVWAPWFSAPLSERGSAR